jgi:hypothetical protein
VPRAAGEEGKIAYPPAAHAPHPVCPTAATVDSSSQPPAVPELGHPGNGATMAGEAFVEISVR